jgi:hypothetical protein
MGSSRFNRLAENERVIREINEEAELLARDQDESRDHLAATEVEFYCACGRADCTATIVMSVLEYETIHEKPHRFIVAHGHVTEPVERVVEHHETYDVVEKRQEFRSDEEP